MKILLIITFVFLSGCAGYPIYYNPYYSGYQNYNGYINYNTYPSYFNPYHPGGAWYDEHREMNFYHHH